VSSAENLATHVDAGDRSWRIVWRACYAVARRWGRLMRVAVAMGVPSFAGHIVELALVGRRTGRPRTVLVTLIRVGEGWYVGHPNGETAWLANLAAADSVQMTILGLPPLRVRSVPLRLGPERVAVIEATARQQPILARSLYRVSRRHILRAGVYHRLDLVV
jgi:hypothetical protein